jgi:selenocysteine-specific translation elongation factor
MSDNISVYEEYLFAKDKTEFLNTCKKSTDLKKFIRICHLLNHPEVKLEKEDTDELATWKSSGYHGDRRNLVLKYELSAILNEGDAVIRSKLMQEFNDRYLSYKFNDSRQTGGNVATTNDSTGQKQTLKTALTADDHKEMSLSTKVEELYNSESGHLSFNVRDLGDSILSTVDFAKVKSWKTKEALFGSLNAFAFTEVVHYNRRTLPRLCLSTRST